MQKKIEKVFSFSDKSISIGSVKLPLLRREYLSSAINVSTNRLKILNINNRYLFQLKCLRNVQKYGKHSALYISTVFSAIYHVASQRVL